MKILVKYNNSSYYWVDTVITSVDCIYAILVSNEGVAFQVSLDKIEVVDGNYHCEKQIQKRIEELNNEVFMLNERRRIDAKIQEAYEKEYLIKKEMLLNGKHRNN